MAANKIVKLLMVSDFNENWYLGVFWSEELVGNDETCIHMPECWYGGHLGTSVFASKLNTIKPSYYYYYSSSSSGRDFVRPNSQRLMIRSLLNFTGRWTPSQEVHSGLGIFKMAAVHMETVNVCQNLWLHLYRKLPEGFPQDLAYILSRVGRIFGPKKIVSEWPPKKSAKLQCSLISMTIDI